MAEEKQKRKMGFACMPQGKRAEIARKGGKAAHAQGKAHEWTSEEAAEAGRLGGTISRGGRGKLIQTASKKLRA
jgi:general stress protein YciG